MASWARSESYAAIWREPGGVVATGKVVLEPDRLRLQGSTGEGRISRRELLYTEVMGVRIGRGAGERLNDRPTLVLERASAPPLQLDVLGAGMLFELADLLAALTLERAERFERVVVVVPLKQDAVEQARAFVSAGAPFDPAGRGLERHEVFFTDTEVVFLFEGPNVGDVVQRLAHDPGAWRAALQWRQLLAGGPATCTLRVLVDETDGDSRPPDPSPSAALEALLESRRQASANAPLVFSLLSGCRTPRRSRQVPWSTAVGAV